jgi:hypothetical protein
MGPIRRFQVLLDECDAVWTEGQSVGGYLQIDAGLELHDPRARAPDVGLDQNRKAQPIHGLEQLLGVVDHDRPRVADAESLEETYLKRLGLLQPPGGDRVDHGDAESGVVIEQGLGIEQHVAVTPRMGRGTRAVHDHGIPALAIRRIEGVTGRVDLLERKLAMLELGQESP